MTWRTIAIAGGIAATGCGSSKPHPEEASAPERANSEQQVVGKNRDDSAAADRAAAAKRIEEHEAANRAALEKQRADEEAAWARAAAGIEEIVQGSSAETALNAAIATLSWAAPPCAGSCPTVIRRASLGTAGELRVVSAPLYKDGPGTGYAVVFGSGERWWSTIPRAIEVFDCGAGHCIEKQILDITVKRRTDRVRVTFTVSEDHYHNEPGAPHASSISDVVIECTLDAVPSCTDGSPR